MMTCLETELALPQYLAGTLSKMERNELLQHLSICGDCAQQVSAMQRLAASLRQTVASTSEPAPNEVPESLLSAIKVVVESEPLNATEWQQS